MSTAMARYTTEEDEDEEGIRTPKVGTVIIDQLRKIQFEPYRLWQPPLTKPVAIDELVNRFLGRPWQQGLRHRQESGVPDRDHRPSVQA